MMTITQRKRTLLPDEIQGVFLVFFFLFSMMLLFASRSVQYLYRSVSYSLGV